MNRSSKLAAIAFAALAAIAAAPAAAQHDHGAPNASAQMQQLNMSAVPELEQASVRQIQQVLQQKGFDPGPIDGIVGPRTKDAVRKYQDRFGMKASGDIDNQMLFALGKPEFSSRPNSAPR